jgi:hypothetical protein
MVALCVRWATGDGWGGALGPPEVRTEKVWPKKVVFAANPKWWREVVFCTRCLMVIYIYLPISKSKCKELNQGLEVHLKPRGQGP